MEKTKIYTGLGDLGFFIMLTILVILFAKDPDLMDTIIEVLRSCK